MTSNVDICNSALNMVGASIITSLSEDSKAARICNQRYTFVRDAVMRAHPWNCLIRRIKLGRDATAPAYKFAFRYPLPADPYCLRVLTVSDDGDDQATPAAASAPEAAPVGDGKAAQLAALLAELKDIRALLN